MKQTYIGYKVPKTLKYEDIEVKENLNYIPTLANFKDFYYIFYNENNKNYIIPQKVNKFKYKTSEQDNINITRFLSYLKKPVSKTELLSEMLTISKEYIESTYINNHIKDIKEIEQKKKEQAKNRRDEERLQALKNKYAHV